MSRDDDYAQRSMDSLRDMIERTERHLASAVEAECPGPHELAQHRDHRPPWCNTCRRTERGLQVPE